MSYCMAGRKKVLCSEFRWHKDHVAIMENLGNNKFIFQVLENKKASE